MRRCPRRNVAAPSLVITLVLGLASGGSSVAQPPGEAPPPATKRAAIRAEAIRLGVELELLQLEQEVDRSSLLDLMRQFRALGPENERVKSPKELAEARKALEDVERKTDLQTDPAGLAARRLAIPLNMAEKRRDVAMRLERKRLEFAARAAKLIALRLDVADVQAAYREAP